MFDQLKKIHELKKMQDAFKKEIITIEKRGVIVTMNGNMEVEEVKLNKDLNIEEQETALKQCLNEAKNEIQNKLAKIMGPMMGGLGF
jgi:DNA-binding protein YbaB